MDSSRRAVRTANVRTNLRKLRKKGTLMNENELLKIDELEIEPITDEILVTVLGGLGEDDGFFHPSCSYTDCSQGWPDDN